MQYFEAQNQSLIFRNSGEILVITPWGENCLRVRAAMMGEIEDTRFALLSAVPTQVKIEIEDACAAIACGKLTAKIELEAWHKKGRISFYNKRGELLLQEISDGGALALKARHFKPLPGGNHELQVSFEGCDDEQLYGMGQYQQETLDVKHCVMELAHRNSQASVPFVLSSKGYGFLWHNPAIGEVAFGKNKTCWKAQATRQMDYLMIAGDTPREISLCYARATGFAPMMPEYGLGFWQCKLRYWNQEQLLNVAREYKRRDLPPDVIVCDFFHWPKMGDFRFDPEFFPDPAAMANELKEMGIELMVSVWPQISLESENYAEMDQKGLLVRAQKGEQVGMRFGGDSMFYDATNPRAREYVWEKCRKNYYDKGVRLFWLDEAEPEYGTYDFEHYLYYMGSNQEIGNIYPQMFTRNFYEGMEAAGQKEPVNLVRCAWAGSQRYGALVWSGDVFSSWEAFRNQLCAGLNMGIAGIPWWTTDIGGFHGGRPKEEAFRELLIRWFQWGTFCPVMRLHGDRQPGETITRADGQPALFSGGDNEIWSFGEEAYPILEKYIRLRHRLRDYTRETMRCAHETGAPVMRAMFYQFPADKACVGLKDQYMYGDKYLVAPIMYPGMREREVYLPKGLWRHIDTAETFEGGRRILIKAPLDSMPVFELC